MVFENAIVGFDTGAGPASVATRDVNGDDVLDLVTADTQANTVSVLLGLGDGTFGAASSFDTGGTKPTRAVLGFFNGDAFPDIAVSNAGSRTIGVLLNDGLGGFGAATTFAAGAKVAALTVARLDADGFDDLAAIAGGKVVVLHGTGSGAFGAAKSYATSGTKPVDLAVDDFNDDGANDIAVANAGSKTVRVLAGTGSDFALATRAVRIGTGASALTTGDFNGDGIDDVAVSHTVSRFVSVLLGQEGVAAAPLRPQLRITTPGLHVARAIAAVDLDGDGRHDLVLANAATGSFSVLLGLGNGTFRAQREFEIDGDPASALSSVALGDFNGDGLVDVAVAQLGAEAVAVALRS